MAFSKVIFNGTTLMDVTGNTAVEADVNYQKTFTKANGVQASGTNMNQIQILFEQDSNGFIIIPDGENVPSAVGVSF